LTESTHSNPTNQNSSTPYFRIREENMIKESHLFNFHLRNKSTNGAFNFFRRKIKTSPSITVPLAIP